LHLVWNALLWVLGGLMGPSTIWTLAFRMIACPTRVASSRRLVRRLWALLSTLCLASLPTQVLPLVGALVLSQPGYARGAHFAVLCALFVHLRTSGRGCTCASSRRSRPPRSASRPRRASRRCSTRAAARPTCSARARAACAL
jgi:hypothetical protein